MDFSQPVQILAKYPAHQKAWLLIMSQNPAQGPQPAFPCERPDVTDCDLFKCLEWHIWNPVRECFIMPEICG